ncbi:relaxin-3 [Varanus komodoensis]|uniref:relaxin-3 n=1 Tax=Varanus komodoensis TaxID=61221 RepID=UPI001CF77E70|nr:relaxin-3 [Varanus komodoensis]
MAWATLHRHAVHTSGRYKEHRGSPAGWQAGVALLLVYPFVSCLKLAMHKLLLALALGVLLSEMRLASEARTPPYGVKLCGREFIRAVIFTCGGSRWRRAENFGTLPGDSAEAFVATSSSTEWDSVHVPAKDLSDYYGNWRGHQIYGPSDETSAVDRGARDVMAGLSNACCKWGCSKSEISSLC